MNILLDQAMTDHRVGRLDAAEQGYRSLLDAEPDHIDALHLLGVTLCQRGQAVEALAWIDRAIARRPDVAGYHGSRGEVLRELGRFDEAAAAMASALELDPSLAMTHNNLGMLRLQFGQAELALASFDEAIRLNPCLTRARVNRGEALQALDRHDEAEEVLRGVLEVEPENPWVHAYLAHVLVQIGDIDRLDEAEQHCRRAIAPMPGMWQAHTNLGNVWSAMGRPEDALTSYRTALDLDPDLSLPWNNIGHVEQQLGRFDAAHAAYEKSLALEPRNPRFHTNYAGLLAEQERDQDAMDHYRIALGFDPAFAAASIGLASVLLKLGRGDDARTTLEEAIRLKPRMAGIHLALGRLHAENGEFDRANAAARIALDLRPKSPDAYFQLASNLRDKLPDADLGAMVALLDQKYLDHNALASLNFGIAIVLHARSRHEEAARHFAAGNARQDTALRRRGQAFDSEWYARSVELIVGSYTPEFFRAVRDRGHSSRRPIFVVGLPRSGTTLVEQVLASHPRVFGAGELPDVSRIARDLAGPDNSDAPGDTARAMLDSEPATIRGLADRYLARLDELDHVSEHVVDKMPSNYFHLGLIATLCPEARIILCRRDPRDVALSCWMNYFGQLRWTNDFRQIAEQIILHDRLIAHWKDVLPIPLVEVVYEEMVADFPARAKQMVESAGLEWHPACLDFHSLKRPVRTASLQQVRQPINSRSVGRWKDYQAALSPLFETFARYNHPIPASRAE